MPRPPYDSFGNIPPVAHADTWGNQEGKGGIPPNKQYRKTTLSEAVDYRIAGANYVKRKAGEMPIIPGGLDDEDKHLYSTPVRTSRGQMQYAQHSALSDADVARVKSGEADRNPTSEDQASQDPSTSFVPVPVVPVVLASEGPALSSEAPTSGEDLVQAGKRLKRGKATAQPKVVERVVYKDRVVEKVVEKASPFQEWYKKRIRVQVSTPETTFNISAIAVVRSAYGITLLLPVSPDSMTFVPKVASRVTITTPETGPVFTAFTGVDFEIPELGVFGLSFITLNPDNKTEQETI